MEQKKSEQKAINIILTVLAASAMCFYAYQLIVLHFNQTMYRQTGMFESDLYAHIEMSLDGWGYSVMALIIRVLSFLPGQNVFHFALAAFLALTEIATIAVTYIYFRKEKMTGMTAILVTVTSVFVMPAYIRSIQPYRYIGYQSGSIWHNSTYILMKLCALLCIVLYLYISNRYYSEMKTGPLIAFSLMLALTTGVKTNFVLVFAPVALIFLLVDKILGVSWKRILLCALTVVPTMGVILFQKAVLFGEETGNKIVIDPLYSVYLRAEKPYFTMILSALFPVMIFLVNIVPVIKDTVRDFRNRNGKLTHRAFLLSWSMWTVGFLELILLRETGNRALDDNFAWGYDFCLFFVFLTSIVYFVRDIMKIKEKDKKFFPIARNAVSAAVLLYHTYCGVVFFVKLCMGNTFFMQ